MPLLDNRVSVRPTRLRARHILHDASTYNIMQPDSIFSQVHWASLGLGQMGLGAQESSGVKLSAPVRQIFVGLEDGKIEVWAWNDMGRLGTTTD